MLSSPVHMYPEPKKDSMLRRLIRWFALLCIAGLLVCIAAVGVGAYVFLPELRKYEGDVQALKARQGVGPGWRFHSRLYSSPFVFQPDTPLDVDRVIAELKVRDYEEVKKGPLQPGQFWKVGGGLTLSLRGYELPDMSGPAGRIRLSFKNGLLKSVVPVEPLEPEPPNWSIEPILLAELLGDPPLRCTFVTLNRIPEYVRNAVIASEDSRFWSHQGLDFRGILRAVIRNIQAGELKQGGSTLTQQLARTLFLSTERTARRKLRELAIAVLLDRELKKDALLELYLNSVYLGQQDGVAIHGVQEAARAYFNKRVEDLSLAEAATLSGVIPAPNAYSPLRNPKRALERRNRVLELMLAQGLADAEAVRAAQATPFEATSGRPGPARYGYYTSYVRSYLKEKLGPDFELRGLTIYAELDPVLQDLVQASLVREIEERERQFGKQPDPLQGAAFLMDHQTGRVLAVVGGRAYEGNPFNRASQSLRQPGSAFKPVAFAAALEGGEGVPVFTPGTTVPDLRRTFQVKEGDWRPRNYEADYHDTVSLAKALTKSLNVATVNLVEQIGPQRVADLARKLGFGELKPVLSIGLGTNEVTLERLTAAYATFPAGGLRVEPQAVLKAVDLWGRVVLAAKPPSERVLRVDTAQLMVDLLRSVVIYGTSWTLRTEGYYPRPSAGKTGTTQDEHDAWYVGFTPEHILGVWVGFDIPRHLYGSAADIAVPVWGGIMSDFMKERPTVDFKFPDGLEYVWIDPYSGLLPTQMCPRTLRVAFLKGTAPKGHCPLSHLGDIEIEGPMPDQANAEGESEAPLEAVPDEHLPANRPDMPTSGWQPEQSPP